MLLVSQRKDALVNLDEAAALAICLGDDGFTVTASFGEHRISLATYRKKERALSELQNVITSFLSESKVYYFTVDPPADSLNRAGII